MKPDILYLVKQSSWQHELKYSLRSVEKFLSDYGNVYIVGWMPDYLDPSKVRHMVYEKETNLTRKLHDALKSLQISDQFIYICDDFLFLQPSTPDDCRQAVLENLDNTGYSRAGNTSEWQKMLWKTYDYCKAFKYSGYNAETHTPKLVDAKLMRETLAEFYSAWCRGDGPCDGICFETAYYNYWRTREPVEYAYGNRVHILNAHAEVEVIRSKAEGKRFMFHSDNALNGALPLFLESEFPEKSKFER